MKHKKNRAPPRPPKHKIAWCAYHSIYMNYRFLRRRHCVCWKQCRNLYWCDALGNITGKLNDKPPSLPEDCGETQTEKGCPDHVPRKSRLS